jgi:tRNA(Ile)-lysidine synthetase-like protein
MVSPGDTVICAVSGGADSMALLWGMYLLQEKLQIRLEAAHFNHHLRGAESDDEEAFVRDFCGQFQIPLWVGEGNVVSGEKGLEAAARDARYGFLKTLSGKVATAHTADDNSETVVMHLIRGSGLNLDSSGSFQNARLTAADIQFLPGNPYLCRAILDLSANRPGCPKAMEKLPIRK